MSLPIDFPNWRVWRGKEVEGDAKDINTETLFIRNFDKTELQIVLWNMVSVEAVWFCKEYTNYAFIEQVITTGKDVRVEATIDTLKILPIIIRNKATIYLKLGELSVIPLHNNDYVCIGAPYNDLIIPVNGCTKMSPVDYSKDVRIL